MHVFFLLVLVLQLGLVHGCNEYRIRQCANDFVQSVGASGTSMMVSEKEMDKVCGSAYPVLKQCLKRSTSNCPSTVRKIFEGMFNAFEFLCNDGREDAIKYGECLERPIIKSEIISCQSTMQSSISSSLYSSRATKCGYINTFLDCVKGAAEEECGSDAADFQDKANRLATAPIIESVGCNINIDPKGHPSESNNDNGYYYSFDNGAPSITSGTMGWTVGFAVLLQWFTICILH